MAKAILIDEFHLSVFAPRGLREGKYDAMRQALNERRFQADLGRAVRGVVRKYPPLRKARVRLSR